jgi:hypothetical protein
MNNWIWTPKAYRFRDNLIAGACLVMTTGIIVLMFIKGTD